MRKIPYYGKRQNDQYSYNYSYLSYSGYNNPYKKNNFKGRPKPINIQKNSHLENRNKNYYYNNTFYSFNNSFSNSTENKNSYHSSIFQKNKNWYRYKSNFFEEKKMSEEINNDSINEEEKIEELLKIRVNVSDSQCKELVICKNDDINEKVVEFCQDNGINEKLVELLVNKVNQSLRALEIIKNMNLNNSDFMVLDKVKNNCDINKDN